MVISINSEINITVILKDHTMLLTQNLQIYLQKGNKNIINKIF